MKFNIKLVVSQRIELVGFNSLKELKKYTIIILTFVSTNNITMISDTHYVNQRYRLLPDIYLIIQTKYRNTRVEFRFKNV